MKVRDVNALHFYLVGGRLASIDDDITLHHAVEQTRELVLRLVAELESVCHGWPADQIADLLGVDLVLKQQAPASAGWAA